MLTTVIIVLRECLEAALLISILSVLQAQYHTQRKWLAAALLLGVATAFLYARYFALIASCFDGNGQEIINAVLLLCIALGLGMQITGFSFFYHRQTRLPLLAHTANLIIILAIAREGAEIFLYFSTLNTQSAKISSMLTGGIIGGGIGICMGILVFVLLSQLSPKKLFITVSLLLTLITAGITSEATQLFIQAGLIISGEPLWDTSQLVPEPSVAGQLLYAIFSYEATPTREEILVWLATVLLFSCLLLTIRFKSRLTTKP